MPGLTAWTIAQRLRIHLDPFTDLGTGTDKRHVAPDDVPQLGQFVEFRRAEEAADFRDARAVPGIEGPRLAARSDGHRPELEQDEVPPPPPYPNLPELGRTGRTPSRENGDDRQNRQEDDQSKECNHKIEDAFSHQNTRDAELGRELLRLDRDERFGCLQRGGA